jgi:hypothetical protein
MWSTAVNGPNMGLIYLFRPVTRDTTHIYVHSWLKKGSALYLAQPGDQNTVMGRKRCDRVDIDKLRGATVEHELKHYTEDKKYFDEHDVQAMLEKAYAPIDLNVEDYQQALRNVSKALEDATYGDDLKAKAGTNVDHDLPVKTPGCRATPPRLIA